MRIRAHAGWRIGGVKRIPATATGLIAGTIGKMCRETCCVIMRRKQPRMTGNGEGYVL